jgi:hypothetical protein
MPTRLCRFCLSLQGDSVFADFDVDADGHAFLRRISFDGFGCCDGSGIFRKMRMDDSQMLIDAVERRAVENPAVETALRTYFHENRDVIWSDALASHELI